MSQTPDDLRAFTASTLAHYDFNAADYATGTRDHDVSQNIATLFRHIEGAAPWTILDFGCGPGRDLKTIAAAGHVAVGLDGSARFAEMASIATGALVLQQDFLALDLPERHFDGIYANASLQHVPSRALPAVLEHLSRSLKRRGVLFASIPRGDNEEGWNGAGYGTYHDLAAWRRFMTSAGFVELEHYFRPAGRPFDEQRWLASAWRSE